jgi:hypothetical protein
MSMSHSPPLRISTDEDLRALWRDARTSRRRVAGRIQLELEGLPQGSRDMHEARINKAYFDCACAEATAAGLLGTAAFIAWAVARNAQAPLWQNMLIGFVVFFAAAGVGKLIGRGRASSMLRREVEAVARAARIRLERGKDTGGPVCAVN